MTKVLREVSGFFALPVTLKTTVHPRSAKHYIYVKPHEPRIADEDAPRSLFLINVPVSTSEAHLRHLFATQLSAGRVERVVFPENASSNTRPGSGALVSSGGKKRKRMTADELEFELDNVSLPETLPGRVLASGATAVVVFVDRPSMELSLKAAKKATRQNGEIVWGDVVAEDKIVPSGVSRYEAHKLLQYPPRGDLLRSVDRYMKAYGAMEEARSRENAKKRQMPDEDGFVTVTRGAKGGALRQDEAGGLLEKQKAKKRHLEDFYRFQMRERRREDQGELLRRFEEDKKKVAEMRMRRGILKPES